MLSSPLFHTLHHDSAHFMYLNMPENLAEPSAFEIALAYGEGRVLPRFPKSGSLPAINFAIKTIKAIACPVVSKLEDVEDYILQLSPSTDARTLSPTLLSGGDLSAGVMQTCQLVIASNAIAKRTRRGRGNVALMNRTTFSEKYEHSPTFVSQIEEKVGRWFKVGLVATGITVYVGDPIPSNEVFVAYVGCNPSVVDGPAGLLNNDGELCLVKNPTAYLRCARSPRDFTYRIKVA